MYLNNVGLAEPAFVVEVDLRRAFLRPSVPLLTRDR